MKKLFIIFLSIIFLSMPVFAQESEKEVTYNNSDNIYFDKIDEFADNSQIDLEELKISPLKTIFNTALEAIKNTINAPIKIFYKITAVLLLCAMINFFSGKETKDISQIINIVCVLVIFSNTFSNFSIIVKSISESLFTIKNFMISFLPVFAGISFASGEVITSAIYTGFFLLSIVFVANFCVSYIIPSVNLFLAIGITSSMSSAINLNSLCEFYSKAVKLAMTAAVSILCFALTLQTAITQGQDSLAIKTGKLLVTSAVPIIGTSLQSAVGSVYASMQVLKGFSGLVGIAVILQIFLPSIITLIVNWCGFCVVIVLSDVLENKSAKELLMRFKDVVEILLSMTILFLVLLVFSLSVMIKITQGV